MSTYLLIVSPYNNFFSVGLGTNSHGHSISGTTSGGLTGTSRQDIASFGASLVQASGLDIQDTMEDLSIHIGTNNCSSILIGKLSINTNFDGDVLDISGLLDVSTGYLTLGNPTTSPEGTVRYNSTSKKIEYFDSQNWVEIIND